MEKNKVDEELMQWAKAMFIEAPLASDDINELAPYFFDRLKQAYLAGADARKGKHRAMHGTHDFRLYANKFHETIDFLYTQPVGFDKDGELADLLEEMYYLGAAAQKEADLAAATKALLQHRDVEGFENLPNDLKSLLNRIANTTLKAIKQAEIGDKHV